MLTGLFSNSGFMPHIHCYLDQPLLVWTMFITDLLIGLSYVAISLTLWGLAKKIKIQFGSVVVCFGVFILACGLTHFLEVWTLWHPSYWVSAFVKVITAVASVVTSIYLLQLRQPLFGFAESARLSEKRKLELEKMNKSLQFRFQKIAEATDLGVWYTDLPFDRLIWNDQTKLHFWMPPEQDVHIKDFYERIHPDDRAPTRLAIDRAIESGSPYIVEYRTVKPGHPNSIKWIKANGWTEYDNNGKAIRFDGLTHDITEHKRREEALLQAVSARDNFLSIASHELRTPITGMKLQTQMFSRAVEKKNTEALAPEKMIRFVKQADDGLARMDRLVEDMLDISRIQGGKLTLQKESADFVDLVRGVVERFHDQLATVKISVSIESEMPSMFVAVDRFRLEQVITNLITNAIRYAPGAPIAIKFKVDTDHYQMTFHDRGPGIAVENQERVFERFERLVSASEVSGMGLGLFIVRQIAQAHGGKIYIEGSEVGAKFVLELPISKEKIYEQ